MISDLPQHLHLGRLQQALGLLDIPGDLHGNEPLGDRGSNDGDEPNADHHHDDANRPSFVSLRVEISVAHRRHGGDGPPIPSQVETRDPSAEANAAPPPSAVSIATTSSEPDGLPDKAGANLRQPQQSQEPQQAHQPCGLQARRHDRRRQQHDQRFQRMFLHPLPPVRRDGQDGHQLGDEQSQIPVLSASAAHQPWIRIPTCPAPLMAPPTGRRSALGLETALHLLDPIHGCPSSTLAPVHPVCRAANPAALPRVLSQVRVRFASTTGRVRWAPLDVRR